MKVILKSLLERQADLAKRRNEILSLPLLFLRFNKKAELREIDLELDRVEMEIYNARDCYGDLANSLKIFIAEIQNKRANKEVI